MTYEELLQDKYTNAPVRMADGSFGMMIMLDETQAGVQIPGEDDIRWTPLSHLHDLGNGALVEQKQEK